MQNGGKKKKRRKEKGDEKREREEQRNIVYAGDESSTNHRRIRGISETKFTKICTRAHAHTRFVRCTYTYIHTHVEKTRQNDASPISRIERARVHNISHDPCYPNRFFVSGAILSRNEAR